MTQSEDHTHTRTGDFTGYGFALLPDEATAGRLIEFQNSVAQSVPLQPILGTWVNRPHMTVFQGNLDRGAPIEATIADGLAILSPLAPLTLRFHEVIHKPRGWYFLVIHQEEWMLALQGLLIQRVQKFVNTSTNGNIGGYTQDELASFRQFGYRYVGAAFLPHITLGRNSTIDPDATLQHLNSSWQRLGLNEGGVGSLSFYEMGANGAHLHTVHELPIELRP
jgi:hypothetical protein